MCSVASAQMVLARSCGLRDCATGVLLLLLLLLLLLVLLLVLLLELAARTAAAMESAS
jgi:hypothetical protein